LIFYSVWHGTDPYDIDRIRSDPAPFFSHIYEAVKKWLKKVLCGVLKGPGPSYVSIMQDRSKEFGEAYERYSDELFRHCALRLSDRERAMEITQETFVRAWQYIERGQRLERCDLFYIGHSKI